VVGAVYVEGSTEKSKFWFRRAAERKLRFCQRSFCVLK
jgi:hypothetical protein